MPTETYERVREGDTGFCHIDQLVSADTRFWAVFGSIGIRPDVPRPFTTKHLGRRLVRVYFLKGRFEIRSVAGSARRGFVRAEDAIVLTILNS